METTHSFTRGLDYPSIVAASERIAWTVDSIFEGRRFDPSGPIVWAWLLTIPASALMAALFFVLFRALHPDF